MDRSIERGQSFLDSLAGDEITGAGTVMDTRSGDAVGELPFGFSLLRDGVYYAKEGEGDPGRVCSPLRVTALVRDHNSQNWGRVIEFEDADGVPHRWSLPMSMLGGDGADVRRELMSLGLEFTADSRTRNRLTEYIVGCRPAARAICVQRTGWFDQVFVMPDRAIGKSAERVIYQSESSGGNYAQAGTLDEWRTHVANLCAGNSRLLFAASAAFAGMILHHVGQDSGGVHLVGGSSTGKTTALQIAASVYGGPSYVNNWRATANGLEGLFAVHNDTALVLDELAQVDPKSAGEIVYMAGNGGGKTRSDRKGDARQKKTWRTIFISAGEVGLAQHMLDAGKVARAGQEVRMIDISADAGAGNGIFENLHGCTGGAQLSDRIKAACRQYYGTASIAFLEGLTRELDTAPTLFKSSMDAFVERHLPKEAGGQAARVCWRFAAIAQAGEYATEKDITGWTRGDADAAVGKCFRAWLDARDGGGDQERRTVLSSVKAFFETHGDARFTDMTADVERVTGNRAGFRRATDAGQEFYVLPEAYRREICSGYDAKIVSRILIEAGWLVPGKDGKTAQKKSLPGLRETRCYIFSASMWRDGS